MVGLAAGYGIFGQVGGDYIPLDMVFAKNAGRMDTLVGVVSGITAIRTNIHACGISGAIVGLIYGAMRCAD